ncbi:MAG: hypothetical protein P8O16_15875 [Algoriphagus sp.]|jgi:hypothetical protein|uniref:hypothetical protein n=1 Tax=Algoriphagus sp. TaxID=1872435 RepID=UPI0026079A57|nr:hypothetical protein [Algoriphagus sp.]MDG1278760.1 hypothetical protein [Algoriphagus sp.]
MKNVALFLSFFLVIGCNLSSNDGAVDASPIALDQLWTEINQLASSQNCTDANDWTFTPVGSKPCGGPMAYIAYSRKIDEKRFLELVQRYTELQADFNKRSGAISDCALVTRPSGVICENSKAVLIF